MAFWAMFIVMMGTIYYTLSRMSILKFKPVLFLISFSFILIVIWFRNGLILGGGEEGLIFYNLSKNLSLSASTWADINTGMPNLYWLPRLPFLYAASFFTNITSLPSYIVQAGLFLILILSGVIAMYYLILFFSEEVQQKKLIAFLAALFYLMNPFSMSQVWGRGLYPQFFSFALFPLSLLIFAKALRDKKYIYIPPLIIISVLYSGAFGFITSPITYWVILTTYFLWWLVTDKFRNFRFGITLIFLAFASWFLVHAWWLLPFILEGNKIFSGLINLNDNLGSLIGVSGNFKPHILIRLLQRTYFFDASAYSVLYKSLIFQLISFIPLVFLSVGLILVLRREQFKRIRFFLIFLIGGLIVSLGANPPFGWMFVWVFNHVAVLQAFRNPFEKFGLVYVMGYAPLFALGLWFIAGRAKKTNLYLIPILFLIFGVFAWPMWTGRILAGIDKKIGIKVPSYYEDLNAWLKNNEFENYRLFMTPLLSGEGAAFEWEQSRYNGVDPMHFILDRPAISNSAQIPFYYDFAQNLRNYLGRINVVPSLALLRAKYLAARQDAILISENEAKQEERLTKMIYMPVLDQDKTKPVCANLVSQTSFNSPTWITCSLSAQDGNWEKIKYLHVAVYTDVPAEIEVAVRDINGNRPRWYGRNNTAFHTTGNDFTVINIPLDLPTEYSSSMDYSQVAAVEVLVRASEQKPLVNEIRLREIKLDEGRQEPINDFRLINQFGKLNLYEPVNFNPAPEFGLISSILEVSDFGNLFLLAKDKSDQVSNIGFILLSQNPSRNLQALANPSSNRLLNKSKISKTRYWLQLENKEASYVILSQTYNPEWKIIKNIEEDEVKGGIINDIKLLSKIPQTEDTHFVVNGYANLWIIDSKKAAIIFLPQVYADIGAKISIFSLSAIFTGTLIILARKKFKH